jgi:hypothetical protein
VSRVDDLLTAALKGLKPKPDEDASQSQKKRYSELVSEVVALAFADELRQRGLRGTRPSLPGEAGLSGAERRMAGGIGAKKVDVTWTTEECGLILAISIKSVNWRDKRSNNFQKNLTNRRGDMLFESVTLHRRFPYAVLAGFVFLDHGAKVDGTEKRQSTFLNAHHRFRLFTGRGDPAGRDEQYERLYIGLLGANPFEPMVEFYIAGDPHQRVQLVSAFDGLVALVAERTPDFYDCIDGNLRRQGQGEPKPKKKRSKKKPNPPAAGGP